GLCPGRSALSDRTQPRQSTPHQCALPQRDAHGVRSASQTGGSCERQKCGRRIREPVFSATRRAHRKGAEIYAMDAIAPAVTVTAAMLVAFALALVQRRYWSAELFGGRQTAARSESAIRSAANFLTLDPGALAQPSPPTRATAENVAILPQVTSIEVNARPDG